MRVKTRLITVILAASGLVCLYEFGLSDEAKEKVHSAVSSVKDSCERISKVIADVQGVTMKDEGPLPNAQATEAQWRAIGF